MIPIYYSRIEAGILSKARYIENKLVGDIIHITDTINCTHDGITVTWQDYTITELNYYHDGSPKSLCSLATLYAGVKVLQEYDVQGEGYDCHYHILDYGWEALKRHQGIPIVTYGEYIDYVENKTRLTIRRESVHESKD